jgi:5'-3' exonuclease
VAPYEADAQLAFLNKANIAQLIITEDSDLILFGCEKVAKYLLIVIENYLGKYFSFLYL